MGFRDRFKKMLGRDKPKAKAEPPKPKVRARAVYRTGSERRIEGAEHVHGVVLAVAIALHNVVEGLVMAAPILAATHDPWKGFWLSIASGLTEPLGAVLALTILGPVFGLEDGESLDAVLCVVPGIMSAVSVLELMPHGLRYRHHGYFTAGLVVGGLTVWVTLVLLGEG